MTQRRLKGAWLRRWIEALESSEYPFLNASSLRSLMSVHQSTFYRLKYKGVLVEFPSPGKTCGFDIKKTIVAMKVELARINGPKDLEILPEGQKFRSKSEVVTDLINSAEVSTYDEHRFKCESATEMELFEQAKLKAAAAAREAYRDSMLEAADLAAKSGDLVLEVMLLRTYSLKDEMLSQL